MNSPLLIERKLSRAYRLANHGGIGKGCGYCNIARGYLKMGLAEIIYLHHVGHTFIDHVHALCLYGTSANFCSLCSSEPTGKMAIYYPFIVLGLAWKTQMQSLQDKLDF